MSDISVKTPAKNIPCDCIKPFIPLFGWMKMADGNYVMPYMPSGSVMLRINNCPSCGAYVRDIELSEQEMHYFSRNIGIL